ncbi:MAG: hypothetical protein WCJ22_04095 [Actinomycetes bacterium]
MTFLHMASVTPKRGTMNGVMRVRVHGTDSAGLPAVRVRTEGVRRPLMPAIDHEARPCAYAHSETHHR